MKIIDLIKIWVDGFPMPKTIKYADEIWQWNGKREDYVCKDWLLFGGIELLSEYAKLYLNKKVEIIGVETTREPGEDYKKELIIGFFEKGYCCDLDEVKDTCLGLLKENQELKEKLLVTQTNEETFRLEMEDITKILGLNEDTIFDDVKAYVRSLRDNWNKLRKWIVYNKHNENTEQHYLVVDYGTLLGKMRELEQGSDSK